MLPVHLDKSVQKAKKLDVLVVAMGTKTSCGSQL